MEGASVQQTGEQKAPSDPCCAAHRCALDVHSAPRRHPGARDHSPGAGPGVDRPSAGSDSGSAAARCTRGSGATVLRWRESAYRPGRGRRNRRWMRHEPIRRGTGYSCKTSCASTQATVADPALHVKNCKWARYEFRDLARPHLSAHHRYDAGGRALLMSSACHNDSHGHNCPSSALGRSPVDVSK